jgi:predicted RNase H-like HicB family nuclease
LIEGSWLGKKAKVLVERLSFLLQSIMKFNVTLDRDEDGIWVIECPSIPGCVSQGQTKEEALVDIKDAIAACLEVRAELGMLLTIETHQVEVVA